MAHKPSGRKDVSDLVDWLQKASNRPLMTLLTANGHIGFADAITGTPIRRRDGSILAIASTPPSGTHWKQQTVNEFVKLGLIRETLLDTAKRRSREQRNADTRTPLTTRLAQLGEESAALTRRLEKAA